MAKRFVKESRASNEGFRLNEAKAVSSHLSACAAVTSKHVPAHQQITDGTFLSGAWNGFLRDVEGSSLPHPQTHRRESPVDAVKESVKKGRLPANDTTVIGFDTVSQQCRLTMTGATVGEH